MAKGSAKAEITRLKKLRTPKGVAAFAYLNKPDDSFNKVRYRINVMWPDFKTDPEFKTFLGELRELNNQFRKEQNAAPEKTPSCIKIVDEKLAATTNVPVGTPYMEFDSQPRDTESEGNWAGIPTFNAAGKPDTGLSVYGGDIVRVETQIASWVMPKGDCGLKGYLSAAQLLKSNWTGGSGSTFGEESEFLTDDSSPAASDALGEALEEEEITTEEAPFDATDVEEPVEEKPKAAAKGKGKAAAAAPATTTKAAAPAKGKGGKAAAKPAAKAEVEVDDDPTGGLL